MALPEDALRTATPEVVFSGLSWGWLIYHAEYLPGDGWVVKYAMSDSSGNTIEITASDNGDGYHKVNVPAATTAAYTAGMYSWIAFAEKGADKAHIADGRIDVRPDITAGADARTYWQKVLDALEATIQGKASKDQSSMSIEGRSISRMDWTEIMQAYDRAKSMVKAEEARARRRSGRKSGRKQYVQFNRG